MFSRRECVVFVAAKKNNEIDEQKSKENEASLFIADEDESDAKTKTQEKGQGCKKGWCDDCDVLGYM